MGNILSEEEGNENAFIAGKEGFSLESPDADKIINYGTAAPNWQPKHTTEAEAVMAEQRDSGGDDADPRGQKVFGDVSEPLSVKHRRDSYSDHSSAHDELSSSHKRQHTNNSSGNSNDNGSNGNNNNSKKLSYFQMAKLGYQELVNAIIRPPRADYKMEALGPPAFVFCGKRFTRTDFTLQTKRDYNLECSHWEPVERATDRIPVVVYMHGNSSARVEVIPQLSYLLSLGVAVFAFDFAGSGKSDGEYVSLGYFEREDLSCIVAHLRATNVVSTIALWGRSMGAATALMFGDRDPSIACMILDSSFADLTQLCEELVEKGREQGIVVPNIVVSVALRMIQGSVKKQAGFNIKNISPIAHAEKCFIPALFVAGEHDDFIKKHHSEQLYESYAGDKNLIIVDGDHNSPRPKFMFDSASIFLQTCLQIPNDWALPVPMSMNLMCPPWYFEMYKQRSQRRKQQQQQVTAVGIPASKPQYTTSSAGSTATVSSSAGIFENGFDHDEVGMTAERQRAIQASLFKMLGQADSVEGRGGGDASQSLSSPNSASIKTDDILAMAVPTKVNEPANHAK